MFSFLFKGLSTAAVFANAAVKKQTFSFIYFQQRSIIYVTAAANFENCKEKKTNH